MSRAVEAAAQSSKRYFPRRAQDGHCPVTLRTNLENTTRSNLGQTFAKLMPNSHKLDQRRPVFGDTLGANSCSSLGRVWWPMCGNDSKIAPGFAQFVSEEFRSVCLEAGATGTSLRGLADAAGGFSRKIRLSLPCHRGLPRDSCCGSQRASNTFRAGRHRLVTRLGVPWSSMGSDLEEWLEIETNRAAREPSEGSLPHVTRLETPPWTALQIGPGRRDAGVPFQISPFPLCP